MIITKNLTSLIGLKSLLEVLTAIRIFHRKYNRRVGLSEALVVV
jgi:hypothetical protein